MNFELLDMKATRVQTLLDGHTPKTIIYENSLNQNISFLDSPSINERPKTSRRFRNPTPDEFTNYVVSPQHKLNDKMEPTEQDLHQKRYDEAIRIGCYLFGVGLKV